MPGRRAALLVVDIQQGGAYPPETSGIAVMDGYARMAGTAEGIVAAARNAKLPVIFIQELHRASGVDFGRELDGAEGVHCVEGKPGTDLWSTLRPGPDDFYVPKRRYSAFYGTDLEVLLRGLRVDTVVLIGSLTDVCIHYTFVDAHQRDLYARVVEDCVIGSSLPAHEASLRAMEYLQRGARIQAEGLITHLRSRAGTAAAAGVGA
jgi:nicotinamidase-related amidase